MDNQKLILPAFILIVLAQLFVPAKMIFDKEDVLSSGQEFKFKTAPVDPNDPFRGKYIALGFDNSFAIEPNEEWYSREKVFVSITSDAEGFAMIETISRTRPIAEQNFMETTIARVYENEITVNFPFDRFYMEESKALPAEKYYREAMRDSNQIAYAQVFVSNGEAVLKDVKINGISIADLVAEEE